METTTPMTREETRKAVDSILHGLNHYTMGIPEATDRIMSLIPEGPPEQKFRPQTKRDDILDLYDSWEKQLDAMREAGIPQAEIDECCRLHFAGNEDLLNEDLK